MLRGLLWVPYSLYNLYKENQCRKLTESAAVTSFKSTTSFHHLHFLLSIPKFPLSYLVLLKALVTKQWEIEGLDYHALPELYLTAPKWVAEYQ